MCLFLFCKNHRAERRKTFTLERQCHLVSFGFNSAKGRFSSFQHEYEPAHQLSVGGHTVHLLCAEVGKIKS